MNVFRLACDLFIRFTKPGAPEVTPLSSTILLQAGFMAAMEYSPMPTYLGCVTDISAKIQKYFENNDLDFATYPYRFIEDLKRYCVITQDDILTVCGLAVLWTIIRWVLTRAVFLVSCRSFSLVFAFLGLQVPSTNRIPPCQWLC